jgi:hypothetical protein
VECSLVSLVVSRAGYFCASHSEASRLEVALELLAQVRSQVGFASLEPNLEVGGEVCWSSLVARARPSSAVQGWGSPARCPLVDALSLHR